MERVTREGLAALAVLADAGLITTESFAEFLHHPQGGNGIFSQETVERYLERVNRKIQSIRSVAFFLPRDVAIRA